MVQGVVSNIACNALMKRLTIDDKYSPQIARSKRGVNSLRLQRSSTDRFGGRQGGDCLRSNKHTKRTSLFAHRKRRSFPKLHLVVGHRERFARFVSGEVPNRPIVVINLRISRLPQGKDDPRNHQWDEPKSSTGIDA